MLKKSFFHRILSGGYARIDEWRKFEAAQIVSQSSSFLDVARMEKMLIKHYRVKNLTKSNDDPYCLNVVEKKGAGNCNQADDEQFLVYVAIRMLNLVDVQV